MKNKFKTNLIALLAIPLISISFVSCEDDDEDNIETKVITQTIRDTIIGTADLFQLNFNMKQKANGNDLILNTSNKPYMNKMGQAFNVSKLRYLISDIALHKADGSCFTINEYHLVDASDSTTFLFRPSTKVPEGDYTSISLKFGFDKEDNISNAYPDLTSAIWNWPPPLGGGYHFMQLEGKFDTSGVEGGFATHMGTARNNNVMPTTYEDNHFIAKPMSSSISINSDTAFSIVMNVEQWYEEPYTWDFKNYNLMIMPNYDAQRKLNLNGPSVFTVEL